MGMTNGRTICSKHDEIMSLASEISRDIEEKGDEYKEAEEIARVIESSPALQEYLNWLRDLANSIYALAADAKGDGQSMESGLDNKRDRISELEKEKEELEAQIDGLEEEKKILKHNIFCLEEDLEEATSIST